MLLNESVISREYVKLLEVSKVLNIYKENLRLGHRPNLKFSLYIFKTLLTSSNL